jgi:hypothetical protein
METFLLILIIVIVIFHFISSMRWHSTMAAIASLRSAPETAATSSPVDTSSNDALIKLSRSIAESLTAIERSILIHRTEIESDVGGIGLSIHWLTNRLDDLRDEARDRGHVISEAVSDHSSKSYSLLEEIASQLRDVLGSLSREVGGLETTVKRSLERGDDLSGRIDRIGRILDRLDPGPALNTDDG